MNKRFADVLDIALQRQSNHESPAAILADYPAQAEALQPLLRAAQALEIACPVTLPDANAMAVDRRVFREQLERLPPAPVSPSLLTRLKRQMVHQFPWLLPNKTIQKKESRPMNVLLLKAALALTMIFGSVGGTAVLASESLPNSPAYPLKLAMEDIRLTVANDAADEAALHLSFAAKRADEITDLIQANNMPDTAVQAQLERHLSEALKLAAQQPDETMFQLLTQAQNIVQTQTQKMTDVAINAPEPAQKMLGEIGGFLFRAGQNIEDGLQDPQTFRARNGEIPENIPQETGPCNTGDCEAAGNANHYGQDPDNDGHNGPGDSNCDGDCEPVGDEHHYGQDTDNDGHNGPSDSNCDGDCEPVGDEHHYGQETDNDGHNNPGDDSCAGDCEPVGDQNQHGQNPENDGLNSPDDGGCDGDCQLAGDQNQHDHSDDGGHHSGGGKK